jgi:hypothetical protein
LSGQAEKSGRFSLKYSPKGTRGPGLGNGDGSEGQGADIANAFLTGFFAGARKFQILAEGAQLSFCATRQV